jgi:hypothetical protein
MSSKYLEPCAPIVRWTPNFAELPALSIRQGTLGICTAVWERVDPSANSQTFSQVVRDHFAGMRYMVRRIASNIKKVALQCAGNKLSRLAFTYSPASCGSYWIPTRSNWFISEQNPRSARCASSNPINSDRPATLPSIFR